MKKISKKLLALILTLIMVVGVVPAGTLFAMAASSNESTIYNYFINTMKVNKAVACGVLANIEKESNFNPTSSRTDTNGKTSYGICQWNGGRFTNLKNFCTNKGLNYKNINAQLQFLKSELEGSEKSAWSKVKSAANTKDGAKDVGYKWAQYFERCAHYYEGTDQWTSRATLAGKYWDKYASSTTSSSNYEYATFFFNELNISRTNKALDPGQKNEKYGHKYFAWDLIGSDANVKAPFTGKIVFVATNSNSYGDNCHMVILQSSNKVYFADGTLDYMSIAFVHDDDISGLSVGKKINQGEVFYQQGTFGKNKKGTYVKHLHVEIARGKFNNLFGSNGIRTGGKGVQVNNALYLKSSTKRTKDYIKISKANGGGTKSLNWRVLNNTVSKPATPTITKNVANDIAINSPVSVTWGKIANATGYKIFINDNQVATTTATSYSLKVSDTAKKNIKVKAYNSKYDSAFSNEISVTAHDDSTVTFNVDEKVYLTQKVRYGENAVAPTPPVKEGYTFDGWDKSLEKITQDVSINAKFSINNYQVQFLDFYDKVISTQSVEYLNSAEEPTDTRTPEGYNFVGWSNTDYINVKGNATVRGIYAWANQNIPITQTIVSATRQDDGYLVYIDLQNHVETTTRGRAIVSLKTSEGKLIDTTESAAFSISANGIKNGLEVFVPCENTATVCEVVIVDSFSSGIPISAKQTKTVDQGLMWSDWQDAEETDKTGLIEETRTVTVTPAYTEYRYRDRHLNYTHNFYKWGSWSPWSDTKVTATSTKEVETRNQYNYSKYVGGTMQGPTKDTWSGVYCDTKKTRGWGDQLPKYSNTQFHENGVYFYKYGTSGNIWYNETSKTQYKYRNKSTQSVTNTISNYSLDGWTLSNKTSSWSDYGSWSSWSINAVSGSDSRQVETRSIEAVTKVQYRYKGDGSDFVSREDNSGTLQPAIVENLGSACAGKQVTLFVYKINEASDFTNEYVAQSVASDDGTVSFSSFRLREEPTVETGDFTIAIGIEGTNKIKIIGTIEAPKPIFNVIFESVDDNGIITELSSSVVEEGMPATPPENPAQTGKVFVGWNNSYNCINRFMVNDGNDTIRIRANYIDEIFTVVFVNYELETVEMKKFSYGQPLACSVNDEVIGSVFNGWEGVTEGETVVTSDMIVTASYSKEIYTVEIQDENGNIISTQEVEYGEAVQLPDETEMHLDSHTFCGWDISVEDDELNNDIYAVTGNMTLVPRYMWEETCPNPTANITSGDFDGAIQVELTCDDENAVIYYTTDGSNPNEVIDSGETGIMQYNGMPITINMSCELKFIACSMNKNDSEVVSELYAINGDGARSPWMLYDDIPQNVKDNLSHHNMITAPGYRYKNLETAMSVAEEEALVADGWTYIDSTFSEWSEYSLTEPVADSAIIEVETTDPPPVPTPYYVYTHWKYFDEATQKYICSNVEVEGTAGEWETIELDSRLYVSSFIGTTPAYTYDGENWFDKGIISKDIIPEYKLYRYRTVTKNYYKWTEWTDEAPAEDETREIETSSMVFSYTNPDFYVITIDCGTIALEEPEAGSYVIRKLVYGNCPLSIDESEYMVDGYDFAGFYTDAEFTQPWDMNANITDSITLYSKYNIKTYTVDFVKEDGEVIDTQTVEYLGAAVPPEVITPDGYVFMGWDTDDYEWVTDNLTVTARILDEDDVIKISLNRTSFTLMEGSYFKLSATLELGNNTDDTIVWKSSDYSILDVDDNGNVYAVSTGKATITAVASDGATASCVFTVLPDASAKVESISISESEMCIVRYTTKQLTAEVLPATAADKSVNWKTSNNAIASVDENGNVTGNMAGTAIITATSQDGGYKDYCLIKVIGVNTFSTASIDFNNGIITGLAPSMNSLDGYLSVSDDSCQITFDTLGTDSIVYITRDDEIIDAYTVVIFGDVNGDGWYDGMDSMIVSCIANGLLSESDVGEAVYMAADCNHDGVIDQLDVDILQQAGVLLAQVDQSKSEEELLETSSAYVEYLNLIDQTVGDDNITDNPIEEPYEPSPMPVYQLNIFEKIIAFFMAIWKYIFSFMQF